MYYMLDRRARRLITRHNAIRIAHVDPARDTVILEHASHDRTGFRYTVHVRTPWAWTQISSRALETVGSAKKLLDDGVSACTYEPQWWPLLQLLDLALPKTVTQAATVKAA